MPTDRDVQRLLTEASHASSLAETRRLVGEAEALRTELIRQAERDREVDFANAVVNDHLTPVRVHEHHTAATDWLDDVDTRASADMDHQMVAQASLWYSNVHPEVKSYRDEFAEQARGVARRMAGAYGESADVAESAFLSHVASLHDREVRSGSVKLAVEATDPTADAMPSGSSYEGLPESATTSERAPVMQSMENNTGGSGGSDVVPVNDPGLGSTDTQVDRENGDLGSQSVADLTGQVNRTTASKKTSNSKHVSKETGMQHAQCPTCGGHGRVAVRVAPQPSIEDIIRHGVSGLDQIDQAVDPHDNGPDSNPAPGQSETYPTGVMFPWTMNPNAVDQTIQTNNAQLAQREQLKGASRKDYAAAVAKEAYRRAMAGYDASGWLGDMGAGGTGPGEQDIPGGGGSNLGMPDSTYGYGGDNGNQPMLPYGQDETADETNNPSSWQPGQPTQMDMSGGGGLATQAPPGGGAPPFPNPPSSGPQKQSSRDKEDPQLQHLLAAVRNRRAYLQNQR